MLHKKLSVSTLSPIHMGTGDSYELGGYTVVLTGASAGFYVLNPYAIIDALPSTDLVRLENLTKASRTPDTLLKEVFNFFIERSAVLSDVAIDKVLMSTSVLADFIKHFKSQNISDMAVNRTAYTPFKDSTPYIPGSAIKGAIRTAWLSAMDIKAYEHKRDNKLDESKLLGYSGKEIQNDPFRLLKVGDAQSASGAIPKYIQKAHSVRVKPSIHEVNQGSWKSYWEVIGEGFASAFSFDLLFQGQLTGTNANWASSRFSWEEICEKCNQYYGSIFRNEISNASHLSTVIDPIWLKIMRNLLSHDGALTQLMNKNRGFLLRLGRHSGAESKTIESVRSIKIMVPKQKPVYRSQVTQKRLLIQYTSQSSSSHKTVSGLPMGWVWVALDSAQEDSLQQKVYQDLSVISQAIRHDYEKWKLHHEAMQSDLQAKIEASRLQKEASQLKAEQAALAEQKRLESLAALTDEQRQIVEFEESFRKKAQELGSAKLRPHTEWHDKAKKIVLVALENNWSQEDKVRLHSIVKECLPMVIQGIEKSHFNKMRLNELLS